MLKQKPKRKSTKSSLLKTSLKLGRSRKQTLLALVGVIVALGASFGVYSHFRGALASGCPYSYGSYACIGNNNQYGEDMYGWACQTGAYNGRNTVKAHFAVYHSRAGNHTYWGMIRNYDATSNYDTWGYSPGTTVSGFQTLNAQVGVLSSDNNYLNFYAGWGPGPGYNGYTPFSSGLGLRPSALPHC
jgi:hypothetical protein